MSNHLESQPKIESHWDLRMLTFGPSATVDAIRRGESSAGVHVVRVLQPSLTRRVELESAGYFCKPQRVGFELSVPHAVTGVDDSEVYARTLRQPRRTQFRSCLRMTSECLKKGELMLVEDRGLEPQLLDEFVQLYCRVIGAKHRGRKYLPTEVQQAGSAQDYFAEAHFGLYLRNESGIVAGVIVRTVADAYSIHYSAVSRHAPMPHLQFYLIWQLLQRSIREGRRILSYGSDTNLYGHHLTTGLLNYKISLNFHPVIVPGIELAKFVAFSVFTFPIVFFALDPDDALRCVVLSPDQSSSRVPGLSRLRCPIEYWRVRDGGLLLETGS